MVRARQPGAIKGGGSGKRLPGLGFLLQTQLPLAAPEQALGSGAVGGIGLQAVGKKVDDAMAGPRLPGKQDRRRPPILRPDPLILELVSPTSRVKGAGSGVRADGDRRIRVGGAPCAAAGP